MQLKFYREHPVDHDALSNVGVDQHHARPENIDAANTTLVVYPLPSGPYIWDVAVPFNARVVEFSLRSNHTCSEGGGKSGVAGMATRSLLEASTISFGGPGTIATSAYNAIFSKKAGAMNLSHKVFSSVGDSICLTDAYLFLVSGTERVLRLTWTSYGSFVRTLNCWAEIRVIG